MQQGSREEMKKQAKLLGARVGDSITGKTDMLVCGEKVGAAKLEQSPGSWCSDPLGGQNIWRLSRLNR